MRDRYRELVLSTIAQKIRTEFGAPQALNAPLVAALEDLKSVRAHDEIGPPAPACQIKPTSP